jgi:hypothetical protein
VIEAEKATKMAVAKIERILFATPGYAFCSWITKGMPISQAAIQTEKET